jgi:tetratricopeptide (TPR) repeat protein
MATSLKQSTVLVVDDFPSMRTMLTGFLKTLGVTNIENSGNGRDALMLLAKKPYDIVLCDYNLGHGKNGQQILEEAKFKNYVGYSTIWVMVTAEKTMDMFMGAAETKPDDYLLKPVTVTLLEARLNKLIERKKLLEPIEKAVKSKDYIRAIALCDEQLKVHTQNTQELLRIKGELLMTVADYPAAKAFFEKVLSVRNIPWAKIGLGSVHFMTKDYFHAKEFFQEVLDENKMYLEAADWLAKSLEALGDAEQAQNVLVKAMELSPLASGRQKNLADVALKNGALDLAQTSYEKAIKLGEHSIHKSSNTYTGLAKVLTAKDNPAEALKVLGRSRENFKDDHEAALQTAVIEGLAYQKMGEPEKAEEALAVAEGLMRAQPRNISVATTMEMANVLFELGHKDKACGLLESVVKNNHENTDILNMVEAAFENAGIEEGSELIKRSSQEVIDINNEGVVLANAGKFDEGIKLIKKALQTVPDNDLMITNLCGMMIGLMTKNGKDDRMIFEVREHLDRVRKLNPANKKFNTLTNALSKLSS